QHMLDVAQRLSGRVSLRERLLIHYAYADNDNDPARLAIAESLSAASREAPESEIALGESLMMADRAAEAILHFERAISLDSANLRGHGASPLCWACDAEHWLLAALFALDSVDAAVRAGHTWAVEQPRSADAWNTFAEALTRAARNGEASAALDSGALYESKSDELLARARLDLEADRYDSADALLGQLVGTGTVPNRTDAIWLQVISLRAQGRRREALSVAQGPMRWVEHALEGTAPLQFAPIAEAQALFELGRYREAALVFRMLAQRPAGVARVRPHLLARQNAWWLTHLADALAAAGDTESLGALADSIEAWGSNSGFARDQWVHRYVRALLWMARSRTDSAVAQLLASHLVRPGGFSRANLALAKCEIRLHNPGAAILALRPSLHSEVEGGNYYATRTEVHEAMAQAFDAAGQVDSAAAHYRAVISAWAKADPELLSRVRQAKARLLYLERHETKS
ncbi:MAG TPA: hypothetical protein VJQ83_02020, partial [Tepidiformaceae bacterium]|nr:hypothetical protein [Tepidiformaceae bacterium]